MPFLPQIHAREFQNREAGAQVYLGEVAIGRRGRIPAQLQLGYDLELCRRVSQTNLRNSRMSCPSSTPVRSAYLFPLRQQCVELYCMLCSIANAGSWNTHPRIVFLAPGPIRQQRDQHHQ